MNLIEFHIHPDLAGKVPPPIPASQAVPEWLRAMPVNAPSPDTRTVKRCIPFLEAMTAGYFIPMSEDVQVILKTDGFRIVQKTPDTVQIHLADQFPGAPFDNMPALKFNSPWIIKTPPGYSTLFLQPLNRIELPLLPLAGVVDTDTYYNAVSFPALFLLPVGSELKIPRGTPLVQVIPFKREPWQTSVGPADVPTATAEQDAIGQNNAHYRDQRWQKKSFG